MLRYISNKQLTIEGFKTPFETHLNPENKWVKLANAIPWDDFVSIYTHGMSKNHGRPSIPPRVAVAALIIKHMEDLDDRSVVAALEENIYMQYFAGYPSFTTKPPFDPSMLVDMRIRMGAESFDKMIVILIKKAKPIIESIDAKNKSKSSKIENNNSKNDDNNTDVEGEDKAIVNKGSNENKNTEKKDKIGENKFEKTNNESSNIELEKTEKPGVEKNSTVEISDCKNEQGEEESILPNSGKLKIDATVADQKIKYPTDIGLLNTSREESERLIDIIYKHSGLVKKPRTYRDKARKEYLQLAMKKKKTKREIRLIISKQLRFLKRNIASINKMLDQCGQIPLSFRDLKIFWVIQHIYDQQLYMYVHKVNSHQDRIVNIYQPHVRAIPRGKDKHSVEFGAKLGVSEICGFSRIDRISWDAYSESKDLVMQVEHYKEILGYYPAIVMADGAYLSKSNREYLKARNIRHTGKPLGRPKQLTKAEKLKIKQERGERNHIEGKFGQAKNGYGLVGIRARRQDTSEAWISGIWLAMNLKRYMNLQPIVGVMAIIFMLIAFFKPFFTAIISAGKSVRSKKVKFNAITEIIGLRQLQFLSQISWVGR